MREHGSTRRNPGGRSTFSRIGLTAAIAASSLAVCASSAPASVTVGQLAPTVIADTCGGAQVDLVQLSVTSGAPYEVKGAGTITSWSTRANATAGATYILKIFRPEAEPNYRVVGADGPRILTPSVVNSFAVTPGIPVQPGDLLGLNRAVGGSMCGFVQPGSYRIRFGDLANGASGAFLSPSSDFRLNIAAQIEPSNQFQLGAVTRNKKKGTATIAVTVPGPGELSTSGNGVKPAGAGARPAASVEAPGEVLLPIRAKGKKKRKLSDTGKVKLTVDITYTPTGGVQSSTSTKLKLKKKL